MTSVWAIMHNIDDYKYLSAYDERYCTFPRRDGTSELATWEPQHLTYESYEEEDNHLGLCNFPAWCGRSACDLKAKEIIGTLTADDVEFLPLFVPEISHTRYFAIHVLTTLDCLDNERSEFGYFGDLRMRIDKYEFKPDCIGDTPIFKLPIFNRNSTYVTDSFKQLVEDNDLTGLEFRKVWEG